MIRESITQDPRFHGRHRPRAASVLALVLLSAATVLPACGEVDDDTETATTAASLTFPAAERVVRRTCGQKCTKAITAVVDGKIAWRCLEVAKDCSVAPSATLHADAATGAVFPAYNQGPTWQYHGCGPQAAQNVLNYYGFQMPIASISGEYIPTFALIAGELDQNIATFPDSLARGLQRLLNEKVGGNHFVVHRRSGVNVSLAIKESILKGNPIIVLVNNGNHYQVVTGYNDTQVHVTDYPGNDHWRSKSALGLDLPWYSDIFSTVTLGAGGYEDNTVITIDYVP